MAGYVVKVCDSSRLAVAARLNVQPTRPHAALPQYTIHKCVFLKYLKHHTRLAVSAAAYISSEAATVVRVRDSADKLIQGFGAVARSDNDGSFYCIAKRLQNMNTQINKVVNHLQTGYILQARVACFGELVEFEIGGKSHRKVLIL